VPEYDCTSAFFRQATFTYDAQSDTYLCPRDAQLRFRGNNYITGVRFYQAATTVCASCPV
jgi:hypothetical protein